MIDTSVSLDMLNESHKGSMAHHLNIEFIEISNDYLVARMPVNERTTQQLGMLHGGASASLAESVGGVASYLSLDRQSYYCLGLEIKCNHVKTVKKGFVYATAVPMHLGTKTHIWQIKINDENDELVSLSTLTMAILELDEASRERIRAFSVYFRS